MSKFAIILLVLILLSLVSYCYKKSGYPTISELLREMYVTYLVRFKYKGYRAIVFYSHLSDNYHLKVWLDNEKEIINETNESLRELRKIFKEAINDYLELDKFND